ncbi:protein ILRUN [Centruroides vittatus]|uniref:protein ILRUN n=1 Tax=Centruroides vittatus TaxID=120091 RepID=UPI00350F0F40
MEVDSDIEGGLLQQFSCLTTTDRDVLISELQKLLGDQLNAAGCAFFLDMNNWNLQAAVCSYFDFESPKENLPSMSFVKDVTIGEGEAIPPNTKFVKTWRIQNHGDNSWPPGCGLKFTSGDRLGHEDRVLVESLRPREIADVSVEMISPIKPGIYQGQWRMCTATGHYFGEIIWVIVSVAEGGLLGVTQQMEAFHQLGSPPRNSHIPSGNPFAPTGKYTGVSTTPPPNLGCIPCPGASDPVPILSGPTFPQSASVPSSPVRHPTVQNSTHFGHLPSITSSPLLQNGEPSTEEMTP